MIFLEKRPFGKKCHLSEKKHLRVPGPIRKYPFTGGAEAFDGAPDGPQGNETQD